ncbi:unnamed protein product [Dovyalis caffra]|uniref:Uncharacterized protein n=1 Tax=Dovyalis caffra TaxID=77055 RepID=A0AAV1SJE4_9ROSI|nr:unnamed protein product [Dovyalis caffra]
MKPTIYKIIAINLQNQQARSTETTRTDRSIGTKACKEVMSGRVRLPTRARQGRRPHDKRRGDRSRQERAGPSRVEAKGEQDLDKLGEPMTRAPIQTQPESKLEPTQTNEVDSATGLE